ncbi:hypothetical protein J7L87_05500 [bacterium]|nr:hypothetical protein [bacterium]
MKKIFSIIVLFIFPSLLFGWGKGHDQQMELVLKLLPSEIRSFFPDELKEKIVKKYSHYPDSFEKIDPDILTSRDKKLLKKFDINVRYDFHKAEGKAISFILMTEGFKEKNPKKAAIFMCALTHVLGDDAACNHAPLVHILTYGFSQYRIKRGEGLLDFSQVKDKKIIEEMVKSFQIKEISPRPEETLFKIMIYEVKLNTFMSQRDTLIAKTFNYRLSEKEKKEGLKALAELGVEGAKLSANLTYTAWIYAKENKIPVLTSELIEKYKKEKEKYLMEKPLEYDSIYKDVIQKKHRYPAIGVLVEPTRRLNECYFCFSAKLIQTSIMRVFKKEGISYKCIDVRDLIKGKKIDEKKIPVLIICAGKFSVPEKVIKEIKRYSEKGGKLIWIGVVDRGLLGELSGYLKEVQDRYLPVTKKYGDRHKEVVGKIEVYFENELKEVLGEKPYKFVNNPNTPAGWQRPYCSLYIEEKAKNVKILAKIKIDGKTLNIAGYLMDKNGKPRHIFLPEYLLSPFLLVEEDTTNYDFSKPLPDTLGRKIINSLFTLLFPSP